MAPGSTNALFQSHHSWPTSWLTMDQILLFKEFKSGEFGGHISGGQKLIFSCFRKARAPWTGEESCWTTTGWLTDPWGTAILLIHGTKVFQSFTFSLKPGIQEGGNGGSVGHLEVFLFSVFIHFWCAGFLQVKKQFTPPWFKLRELESLKFGV